MLVGPHTCQQGQAFSNLPVTLGKETQVTGGLIQQILVSPDGIVNIIVNVFHTSRQYVCTSQKILKPMVDLCPGLDGTIVRKSIGRIN